MERIIELFKKKYLKLENESSFGGDKLVSDSYRLSQGVYFKISKETGKIIDTLIVNKETDKMSDSYEWFAKRDLYSNCINDDTNKALDLPSKKILSTNCYVLSFKAKTLECILESGLIQKDKDSKLTKDKFENENITKYYLKLMEISKNKEIQDLAKLIRNNLNLYYDSALNYLTKNFTKPKEEYIKIFIDTTIGNYKQENLNYLNTVIYNGKLVKNNNQNYGITFLNTINAKKRYLTPTTFKYGFSQKMREDNVIITNRFIQWSKNQPMEFYIPCNYDFESPVSSNLKELNLNYSYYIKKIGNGICDVKLINNEKEIDFKFINMFENNDKIIEDYKITEKWKLISKIKSFIFINDTFKDKKIDINAKKQLEMLQQHLNSIIKKNQVEIDKIFKQHSLNEYMHNFILQNDIIKSHFIYNPFVSNIMHIINLYVSIQSFIKKSGGDYAMSEEINDIRYKLININWKQEYIIQSDIEMLYISGQLASYFNSLRQTKEKNYDFVFNFINSRKFNILKEKLEKEFKKRAYKIKYGARVNILIKAVLLYSNKNNNMSDTMAFLIGSLDNCVIYNKNQDDSINNDKKENGGI